MLACFAVVGLATYGITKWITWQNKQIEVSIDVFEDLNLKNLLNMVTRTENSLKTLSAEKARYETELNSELTQAEIKRDSDIHALEFMKMTRSERNAQIEKTKIKYQKEIAQINGKYSAQIKELESQIADYQRQLNELNNNELQKAHEQQAAIDSQRKIFEFEKQKLISDYEAQIVSYQNQLESLQKNTYRDQKRRIDEISKKYVAQINALDPSFVNDEKGKAIIANTMFAEKAKYDISGYTEENTPEELLSVLQSAKADYDDIDYLAGKILEVPHENSVPQYINSMRQLALSAGNKLTYAADSYIVYLLTKVNQLEEQLAMFVPSATAPPKEETIENATLINEDVSKDNAEQKVAPEFEKNDFEEIEPEKTKSDVTENVEAVTTDVK